MQWDFKYQRAPLDEAAVREFARTIRAPERMWRDYYVACRVLDYFLGRAWVEKNILLPGREGGYIAHTDEMFEDKVLMSAHIDRVCDLGDMLFNLQVVEGFRACIDHLSTGNIEAARAELETASFLWVYDAVFRFIVPNGVKGESYDLEVQLADGTWVPADIKCKVDGMEMTSNGVLNTLQQARTQLPVDRPSFVFLRVPGRWVLQPADSANWDPLNEGIGRFLKGTRRVVSVKAHTHFLMQADGFDHPTQHYACSEHFGPGVDPDRFSLFAGEADPDRRKTFEKMLADIEVVTE